MEAIQKECDRLQKKSNLSKSISTIDHCLELLRDAGNAIDNDPTSSADVMARLEGLVNADMNGITENIKEVHAGLGKYGKALDKRYKSAAPISEYDLLSEQDPLINRAIAMHLIREGQFETADLFIREASIDTLPTTLQSEFSAMFTITSAMKRHDLRPAIEWAASKRAELETRGSNLEFELHRLMFVHLFMTVGPAAALEYGRREFAGFQKRYLGEITKLSGALAFINTIPTSPYASLFSSAATWSFVTASFTSEFCSLLHLSASSPLYVAVTAGAIALPTLIKMSSIMRETRTEWTSRNELPVEIPLLEKYRFHSIFVCPVSKEQTTEENPPMMLPCGHVIAQESLTRLSKGGNRLKCPYCPMEGLAKDAKRVYL